MNISQKIISRSWYYRTGIVAAICWTVFNLIGCAALTDSAPVGMSSVRPSQPGVDTAQITIKREDVVRALEASRGSSNIRIVPLVTSAAQAPATPEYRIFNVRGGSIAAVLGLKNADILISAHDFVVQAPQQFYNYLQILPQQTKTMLEIRREGKPLKLDISIVD